VFVLREAFQCPHREIAAILDVDEVHSRQLHHRAHQHLSAARRRFPTGGVQHRRIVRHFLAATVHGNLAALGALLVEDTKGDARGAE
jgi:hypothetical protein